MLAKVNLLAVLIAMSLAFLFVGSPVLRADDAPAKPASLPQIGLITVKSIDSATAFVKQVGLDLPNELKADALEKQFPFLGPGSLDTTRPIGIVVCGSPDLTFEQMLAFVFPVKPTGATLDSLKQLGGTIMPDHADTVVLGGVGIRRTADYLIFSPNPIVATSVDTDAMVSAVKGADALAKMEINFKIIRTKMPDQYKAMLGTIETGAKENAATDADKENSMMFVTPLFHLIDTIDLMDVGLENGAKGTRLAITGTPMKIATAAQGVDRPGMPDSVIARVDMNLAASDSTTGIRAQIQKAFNTGATRDGNLTVEQKKKLEDIGNQLGGLVFDAATTSTGVAMVGTDPVLYIVQHWTKDIDVPAEWKRLADQVAGLPDTKPGDMKTETYTEEGATVVRVNIKSGAADTNYVDIAQRGHDVFMTISRGDKHAIAPLLAAKSTGPMKGILSGYVDLGKALEGAVAAPGSPIAGLPIDVQKQLGDLLRDQKIAIGTYAEGDSGTIELTITKGLMENFPKMMEIVSPKPAAAPEAK